MFVKGYENVHKKNRHNNSRTGFEGQQKDLKPERLSKHTMGCITDFIELKAEIKILERLKQLVHFDNNWSQTKHNLQLPNLNNRAFLIKTSHEQRFHPTELTDLTDESINTVLFITFHN